MAPTRLGADRHTRIAARWSNRRPQPAGPLVQSPPSVVGSLPTGAAPGAATSIIGVRLDSGAATHVGLHRRENQDRYLAHGTVFAVADGLGGYAGGATAAGIATEVLARDEPVESLTQLIALVGSANLAIFEAARDDPHLFEMSTTLCVLAGIGNAAPPSRLAVCNVGDSRLYALAADRFSRVTIDHTISENLVRDGVISAAEAATDVDRHTLTRAVGFERRVHVDGWELVAAPGTRFLLCSDGLTNEVRDAEIAATLRSVEGAGAAAGRLVERAVRPGHGRDNVTAVVVDVVGDPELQPDRSDQLVVAFRPAVLA